MNIFRLLADLCHLTAIISLIYQIYDNKSCTGTSGKTQILYALVFSTRYVDLFLNFVSVYNSILKVVFILSSYFTLYLIYFRHRSTYEYKDDSFRFECLVLLAVILAFFINHEFTTIEILWAFSIYLEAVAIIPQLYMFYNTEDVSMFPSHYVFVMGCYRVFYICNWIWRYYMEQYYDIIAITAGVVQTVWYLLFFYLYVTNKYNIRETREIQTVVV